jgi:tetratricopeptide (TPR) repeat protein
MRKKTSKNGVETKPQWWLKTLIGTGGLGVIVVAFIGLLHKGGNSSNSVGNVSGKVTATDHSSFAQQNISAGSNGASIYAPQTINYNYYTPNSNSVTKDAIEALENRLSTASNIIELTVGEVQKLTQALRDLDQRTSAIEKLPDGRTRFGDIIAGTPKALLELSDRAIKNIHTGDFTNAMDLCQEIIKLLESVPDNTYTVHDSLPPSTKAYYYNLAANCATTLKRFGIAYDYAKKSYDLKPSLRYTMMLSIANANLGQDDFNKGNLPDALQSFKRAIDLYETGVNYVNHEGSYVGVCSKTNSAGKPEISIFTPRDELYSTNVAAGLYAEAAAAALYTGNNGAALDYGKRATSLDPTDPYVKRVWEVVQSQCKDTH